MALKPETFCGNLWRSLSIDKEGSVFACCHSRPCLLGNLRQHTLEKIWNGKSLVRCREASIQGTLGCFSTCTVLENSTYTPRVRKSKDLEVDYKKLIHLVIFFGNQCNLRCVMCRQDHADKSAIGLDLLMSRVNFDHIKYVDILGGEPFIIRDALKFFDFLIARKIKAGFISNGTVMTDLLAEKLARHCYSLMISLNAATPATHEKINVGSSWHVVMKNIQNVAERRRRGKTGLVLHGRMTLVPQNLHEVPLFIKQYRDLGFDRIDFGFDQGTVPGFLQAYPALRRTLGRRIERALKGADRENVLTCRLRVLGLIK